MLTSGRMKRHPLRALVIGAVGSLGQPDTPNEHLSTYDDVYQGKPGNPGPGGRRADCAPSPQKTRLGEGIDG